MSLINISLSLQRFEHHRHFSITSKEKLCLKPEEGPTLFFKHFGIEHETFWHKLLVCCRDGVSCSLGIFLRSVEKRKYIRNFCYMRDGAEKKGSVVNLR